MASRAASKQKGELASDRIAGDSIRDDKCEKCGLAVKEGEKGMQCEICEGWLHAKCEHISDEGYKVLQMDNIHWYCCGCNKGVGKVLIALGRIQRSQDYLENQFKEMQGQAKQFQNTMEFEVKKMKEELDGTMNKMMNCLRQDLDKTLIEIDKKVMERITEHEFENLMIQEVKKLEDKVCQPNPKWSEIVSKEVKTHLTGIIGDIDLVQKSVSETKDQILETEDKLKRINNIIMFNVEESKLASATERNEDDMKFCGRLMAQVLKVGYEKGDIARVVRLGKFEDSKKRPMLIEFSNAHVKNLVMGSLTNLGSAQDEFKGVTISHDMTIKERELCKQLVEEARKKQNEDSGNFIYRVRGLPGQMKIVKFRRN